MTVHRTRFHRSVSRRHARPGPAPTAASSSALASARSPRASLSHRALARLSSDQGDVPGWVLITLMTAGIVVALWAVASDQIVQIFENAMSHFLGGSL